MTERSDETPRAAHEAAAGETAASRGDARETAHDGRASGEGAQPQPESAKTLGTVVETVRRVVRSDTASVVAFSLAERTITWKAMSGFGAGASRTVGEIVMPLRGLAAEHVATSESLLVLEGVGVSDEYPASEFPLHSAEGVRTIALAPLRARGEMVGALLVGFRSARKFTDEERRTLEGLAEMAAVALDNARLLEIVGAAKRIWEQTFDAIPDGVIVHDAEMVVTRANAAAAEMLGLDAPSQAVGLSCADAFARLFGERAAAYHMTMRAGASSSFEVQAEDGRRHLVAVASLEAVEGEAGWSVITWSDVTQLSEMQEQLARSRRLATVGHLAAGVAHEINNPLAAITACAEATLRDIRSDEKAAGVAAGRKWNFYLEEIVRQALRCKLITRGLLDLARQRRARREPCDLNALAAHTLKLFEQRASAREGAGAIEFALDLDEALGEIATDEGLVRQILDNLLTNAADAIGAGGGTISLRTEACGERACVEVCDTGAGIAPETLPRIFEPFFTTKEAGKGSGLGLAVATTLAEALGGALAAESKLGAGSRFRLWLPRRAPEGLVAEG